MMTVIRTKLKDENHGASAGIDAKADTSEDGINAKTVVQGEKRHVCKIVTTHERTVSYA
jgi:hypothetical protein